MPIYINLHLHEKFDESVMIFIYNFFLVQVIEGGSLCKYLLGV